MDQDGGSSSTVDFIFGYTAREEDDDVGLISSSTSHSVVPLMAKGGSSTKAGDMLAGRAASGASPLPSRLATM